MAITTIPQTNFTAGEWSPRLDGRVDVAKYANALKECENVWIFPHGGYTKRPGTEFIAEVKTSSLNTRLIPFEFSTEQAYVLEFGDEYMRVFKDGGAVLTSGAGSAVYEIATPYAAADLDGIRYTQSADTMYLVHRSYAPRKLTRADHNDWSINLVDFSFWPQGLTNTTTTTLAPSATSGDGITITAAPNAKAISGAANNGGGLIRITATAHGFSTGARVYISGITGTTEANGTWTINRISANTFDLRGSTFTNAYSSDGTASAAVFTSDDVGRAVSIRHTVSSVDTWGQAMITAYTNPYTVTANVVSDFTATSASNTWAMGAFSATGGYPGTVAFYEERLAFASSANNPQTIWLSRSNDYESFSIGDEDDDSMILTLASDQVNAIRWMVQGRKLLIGSSGGEWTLGGSTETEALTPTNINAKRQSTYGSLEAGALQVGNAALFISRSGRKVRELAYNYESDSYKAPDLTLLAEHLGAVDAQFVEMCYAQEPDSVVLVRRSDGVLCGMTYQRDQDVVGWHRDIIAGSDGCCNAKVESIACIPGDGYTETWLIVKREIDGVTARYVERFKPLFEGDTTFDGGCWFVDSGLMYDGINTTLDDYLTISAASYLTGATGTLTATGHSPFTSGSVGDIYRVYGTLDGALDPTVHCQVEVTSYTSGTAVGVKFLSPVPAALQSNATAFWALCADEIGGLDHLEGETVSILGDGAVYPNQTVSSGTITLSRSCSRVIVGLGYTGRIKTMRLESGGQTGTSQGKRKTIVNAIIRFFKTIGAKFGGTNDSLRTIPFRTSSDAMGNPPELFTGDKDVNFPNGYNRDAFIIIEQEQPLPMTVTMIVPRTVVNE